jgi:hypothetical protein
MWPFSTQQERQAEAMSQILAENAYERRMERMAGWVRTWFAALLGICLTFVSMTGLDAIGVSPSDVWDFFSGIVGG